MTEDFIRAALRGIYLESAANMDRIEDPETLHRLVRESQEAVDEIMALKHYFETDPRPTATDLFNDAFVRSGILWRKLDHLDDPDTSLADLELLRSHIVRSIEDPEKERWKASNCRHRDAIDAEISRRAKENVT